MDRLFYALINCIECELVAGFEVSFCIQQGHWKIPISQILNLKS